MRYFGLIGYPLGHSFSPGYFKKKFELENIKDSDYLLFPIEKISDLPSEVLSKENLVGFNVTIPYKLEVMEYLDDISESAKSIGAVNTVKIVREGDNVKILGDNTDYLGFTDSLKPFLKDHHTNALVLGTGGSSKAVCYALEKLGIKYKLVSRNKTDNTISYKDLDKEVIESHKLIVNTTPLGMYPKIDNCPEIPYELLSSDHLLYDLVYNPEKTLFLQKGEEMGAVIKNGLEMLEKQADRAWEIWNS